MATTVKKWGGGRECLSSGKVRCGRIASEGLLWKPCDAPELPGPPLQRSRQPRNPNPRLRMIATGTTPNLQGARSENGSLLGPSPPSVAICQLMTAELPRQIHSSRLHPHAKNQTEAPPPHGMNQIPSIYKQQLTGRLHSVTRGSQQAVPE